MTAAAYIASANPRNNQSVDDGLTTLAVAGNDVAPVAPLPLDPSNPNLSLEERMKLGRCAGAAEVTSINQKVVIPSKEGTHHASHPSRSVPLLLFVATVVHAQPVTRPATTQAVTRPANGTGPKGITTQPTGLLINFQDANIEAVLDELSKAGGFILVKEVGRISGKVTVSSKGDVVKPEQAVELINTVLKKAGYAAIQQEKILKVVPWNDA